MPRPHIRNVVSLAAILAFAPTAFAQPEPSTPTITVGDRIPHLAARVEAELRAIGFDVAVVSRPSPQGLPPGVVALVRPSEGGEAIEVWVRDSESGRFALSDRVAPAGSGERAEGAWAIRAVESVRGCLLDIGIEPSPATEPGEPSEPPASPAPEPVSTPSEVAAAKPEPKPAPRVSARPEPPGAAVEVGARFLFSQGGASAAALGTVGGRWSWVPRFGLLADVGIPLVRPRIEESEGTADLQPYVATAGAFHAWPHEAVVPSLEGGVRVVWLRMQGDAVEGLDDHTDEAWLAGPWVGASVAQELTTALHLRLAVSAWWAEPNRDVVFVDRHVGSWGKLVVSGGGFLQFALDGPR